MYGHDGVDGPDLVVVGVGGVGEIWKSKLFDGIWGIWKSKLFGEQRRTRTTPTIEAK